MKKTASIILLSILFFTSCETKSVNSQKVENTVNENNSIPVSNESEDKAVYMSDISAEEDSLEYKGFVIKKAVRKVKPKDLTEAEITDAVIQKNGKTLAKLDGIYYGIGNATDFALFSLLGEDEKQLIVSHTIPRDGIHYIVDFSPNPKIIFASPDFHIGGEDFGIEDIDSDGIYEISLAKPGDYFNFASSDIPYVRIIFQYDKQARKFLPVNHKLTKLIQEDIDNQIKSFNETKEKRFSDILEISLTYLYAGKEKEAWEFYDKNFAPQDWSFGKVEDKEEAKEKIKDALADEALYKFIKKDLERNN